MWAIVLLSFLFQFIFFMDRIIKKQNEEQLFQGITKKINIYSFSIPFLQNNKNIKCDQLEKMINYESTNELTISYFKFNDNHLIFLLLMNFQEIFIINEKCVFENKFFFKKIYANISFFTEQCKLYFTSILESNDTKLIDFENSPQLQRIIKLEIIRFY